MRTLNDHSPPSPSDAAMIDTHCHILPGVDDGPAELPRAIEMARIAAADGVRVIVATPHWRAGPEAPNGYATVEWAARLQQHLTREGIDITILPGAEVMLDAEAAEAARQGLLPTLACTDAVLIEPAPYTDWRTFRGLIFELQRAGYRPVLAHAERLADFGWGIDRCGELHAASVVLQVTALGLRGLSGPRVRAMARLLIKRRLASLLASDAHDAGQRAPRLSALARTVDRLGGRGMFRALTAEIPRRLLGL